MERGDGNPTNPPQDWLSRKRDWIGAGILIGLMAGVPLSLMGIAAFRAQEEMVGSGYLLMAAAFGIGSPVVTFRTRPK